MISLPFLKNKQVGVLGLGKTGGATVMALQASGARVFAWDDAEGARVAFEQSCHSREGGNLEAGAMHRDPRLRGDDMGLKPIDEWPWDTLDLLVMSPGLPYTHPAPHAGVELARTHGVEIVGDIELLYRACPDATYIAITGTNGKSTTTSLIAHILKEADRPVQVGGNLGMPVLGLEPLTLTLSGRGDVQATYAGVMNSPLPGERVARRAGEGLRPIYVLELSSYQLDLIRTTRFQVAVLLNFSPDHLDRHGDMDGYIAAKKHIFDRQGKDDVAVLGIDDAVSEALCRELIAAGVQTVVPIATTQVANGGVWVKDGLLREDAVIASAAKQSTSALAPAEKWIATPATQARDDGVSLKDMKTLQGTHNHQNAAAAYAACRAVGLSAEQIAAGMRTYPGLAHRMQRVAETDGVLFVNDSKATNADASAKSLGTYDTIYWIAGGKSKEGGITSLGEFFPRIRHAFLIGAAQDEFAATLEGRVEYTRSGTLKQAVDDAIAQVRKDGLPQAVVLLAPACASFDQFKSFEERGDLFAALVRERVGDKQVA